MHRSVSSFRILARGRGCMVWPTLQIFDEHASWHLPRDQRTIWPSSQLKLQLLRNVCERANGQEMVRSCTSSKFLQILLSYCTCLALPHISDLHAQAHLSAWKDKHTGSPCCGSVWPSNSSLLERKCPSAFIPDPRAAPPHPTSQ